MRWSGPWLLVPVVVTGAVLLGSAGMMVVIARPVAAGVTPLASAVTTVAVPDGGRGASEADRVRPRPAGGSSRDDFDGVNSDFDDGELDAGQRNALRRAGWPIPPQLAGGWTLHSSRVVDDGERVAALHLVYTRRGERMSLFQRAAPLQRSSLPKGHTQVGEVEGDVREWPEADPPRFVWEAAGERTYVLVGGDRDALLEAVGALPAADRPGVWVRVSRGIGTVVERITP